MTHYKIYAGLSEGFGGANYQYTEEFDNESDANEAAYFEACNTYESYEGLHGLRTIEDIMKEDNITNVEEAEQIWIEERENWLTYYVEEVENDEEINEDEE